MRRYRALRIIITIYKILAILALLGGIIGFVAALVIGNETLIAGIGGLIGSIVAAISLLAFAQLIEVFLAIEDHTRTSMEAQKRILKAQMRLLQ